MNYHILKLQSQETLDLHSYHFFICNTEKSVVKIEAVLIVDNDPYET